MTIYFAPLEGITDSIYRSAHHECFTGVSKYFIPFITSVNGSGLTNREKRSLLQFDCDVFCVPQILTKDAESFVRCTRMLCELGYDEINLNLGCPSGTVTAKGKGSALLRDTDNLKAFLDAVFAAHDLPRVSVKTRIGYTDPGNWPQIYSVLAEYPFTEIIVHPRTRSEFYKGAPYKEALSVCEFENTNIVYNGDVFSPKDAFDIKRVYPDLSAVMCGRGLVANPALAREICAGKALDKAELKRFLTKLLYTYTNDRPEKAVLGRMDEIMSYVAAVFENSRKYLKRLRKSRYTDEFTAALDDLFDECELKSAPYYDPLAFSASASSTPVI
ncbi:MAG: tRNA-dihydrouridine synthase family protein [Clostridia bacterium]|nr:tRNA-dihydrouridine synthase family protein [Clostridia bacterium]